MRVGLAAAGSTLFFAIAPGTIAGLIPWTLTRWTVMPAPLALRVAGGVLVAAGAAVLIHALGRFVFEGRGTPAPVAPPVTLVVGGLYRHVRNPMYVAVLAAILGQAALLGQTVLVWYAAVVALGFVAFVKLYEEPTLEGKFGASYRTYRRAVPGWFPRLRPWRG